jgi:hypothetical protein
MLSTAMVYRHAADLVTRNVGEAAVVVPVRDRVADLESVFALSDVAMRVWTLLDGSTAVDPIVETICLEYDIDRGTAAADVSDLLRRLEDAKLVERVTDRQ